MIDDDGDDCCGRMWLVAAVVDIWFSVFLSYLNKFPSDCWLHVIDITTYMYDYLNAKLFMKSGRKLVLKEEGTHNTGSIVFNRSMNLRK